MREQEGGGGKEGGGEAMGGLAMCLEQLHLLRCLGA